jgi:hypothetical protein
MLEIGGDGVSLLNFGVRSATVLAIRCMDLLAELSHTAKVYRPLIVIEGPGEVSTPNHIFGPTVEFFCRHSPTAVPPMPVHFDLPKGSKVNASLHRQCVVLASCIADGPFTVHLSMACGNTAKKGCRHCFIVGQTKEGGTSLGGTRCNEPTEFESFDREGAWTEGRTLCKSPDGSYDGTTEKTFTLSEAQHQAPVSFVEKISADKELDKPFLQAAEGTSPELLRQGDSHKESVTCCVLSRKHLYSMCLRCY